jgi:hypothetical protein
LANKLKHRQTKFPIHWFLIGHGPNSKGDEKRNQEKASGGGSREGREGSEGGEDVENLELRKAGSDQVFHLRFVSLVKSRAAFR